MTAPTGVTAARSKEQPARLAHQEKTINTRLATGRAVSHACGGHARDEHACGGHARNNKS
jgi:hypothetical protein